jgi:hypothetical protein
MSYSPGEQPGASVMSQAPNNLMAIVSMVTGIVGILGLPACCCSPAITGVWFLIFGAVASITGWIARSQITESGGLQEGENMAMAGLIMGIVEVIVALFAICLFVLSLMGMFALPALEEILPTPSF